MSLDLKITQIKGLIPALDARQITTPYLIDARNTLIDLKGPYSAFTNRVLIRDKIVNPTANTIGFRIGTDSFIFAPGVILQLNAITLQFDPIFTFADDGQDWPWSAALVARRYYFCRRGIGVIQYDPISSIVPIIKIISSGFLPTNPCAVTQAGGRLLIIGDTQYVWSAIDDGTNLTPSLVTGAGFQGLSLIGGTGISIKEMNDGFHAYTTFGVIKGTLANGLSPFRHDPLTRSCKPLTPYCICDLDDNTHIILDEKGFYGTQGTIPALWEPLFGEFITQKVLPTLDKTVNSNIRLFYHNSSKQLWVTVGLISYVYYSPRQEWGVCNRPVVSLVDHHLPTTTAYFGFRLGFIDGSGWLHSFVDEPVNELPAQDPSDANFVLVFKNASPPLYFNGSSNVVGTRIHITAVNEQVWPSTLIAGLYKLTPQSFNPLTNPEPALGGNVSQATVRGTPNIVGTNIQICSNANNVQYVPYTATNTILDAYAKIGLFRYTDQKRNDELAEVNAITIGVDPIPPGTTIDDWNTSAPDVIRDWATITVAGTDSIRDWGLGLLANTQFSVRLYGTNDGGNSIIQTGTPMLIRNAGAQQFYSTQVTALDHTLAISADLPGATYHIKTIELVGQIAGVIL